MYVNVDYEIDEEVIDVNDVIGGICITVGDRRVNKYQNEGRLEFNYEWKPNYEGEYLHSDFIRLMSDAEQLAVGDVAFYDPIETSFSASLAYWIFEVIAEDDLRIAYRARTSYYRPDPPPIPDPDSACGYVVDRCEFCRAVSDAAHEYVDDLRSMPLEWGLDLLEAFEASLADLDEALETCSQTPPQFEAE